MSIRSIKNLRNLKGKRVLVRVDFNAPIKNGKVIDDARLIASLPTIKFLLEKKARVILVSHLGRPEGKCVPALSLTPVSARLSDLIGKQVKQSPEYIGEKVTQAVRAMDDGDILMLENIRFSPEEQKNGVRLAKELAQLADVFVLDGFAVAHRADASVAGVAKYLPSYAGLLLSQEIAGLSRLLEKPKTPFVVVLGGAKLETKVPVIKKLLTLANTMLVGGGIVTTILKARGYGVGDSLVDVHSLKQALLYGKNKKVVMPLDVVIGNRSGASVRHVMLPKDPSALCQRGEAIFDIGPATIRLFSSYINQAKTLVWNGAMGYFEQPPYDVGTLSIARLVASRSKGKAFGVIGGGETVQAMELVHKTNQVDLVSTGGGAMLEFLAGKKLPGIEALKRINKNQKFTRG